MPHHAETSKALSTITDTGLFERLATAVLREANPLYNALVHTGVNSSGKTVKSPIDGIVFVKGANPPHMIFAHHTTGDRDKFEKKLLQDASQIKSKKDNKYSDGDILKTIKLYKEEKAKQHGLIATLVLTFTSEPSQELIRKSEQVARDGGIELDFWSASRIAHFLDTNLNGQYIRKQYLRIEQERLSSKLLLELSQKSIHDFSLPNENSWIERDLDKQLKNSNSLGLTLISGESGNGKSIACYKYLKQYIEDGGYGFVLTDKILDESQRVEQAIYKTLLNLQSSLTNSCGYDALNLATTDKPIIFVLEDINTSGKSKQLLEKMILWDNKQQSSKDFSWKIFCPIYPKFISELDENRMKKIENQLIFCSGFSKEEGINAIKKKYELSSKKLTPLEAENISMTLGNDPLLIALYDIESKPIVSDVIKKFIETKITRLTNQNDGFMRSEYFDSLLIMVFKLLENYIVKAKWSDIGHLNLSRDETKMLRQLALQGDIFRLGGDMENQSILFRHDRVYNWIASKAIAKYIGSIELTNSFLEEPYLAEIIGLSLNENGMTDEVIEFVKLHNPLALFYSLQKFSIVKKDIEKTILSSIFNWSRDEKTHSKANQNLRLASIYCLSETDSPYVLNILKYFKNESYSYYKARFRNGDFQKGIELCQKTDLGTNFITQEQLIEYVIFRSHNELISFIDRKLKEPQLNYTNFSGLLRLSGFVADSRLINALQYSWKNESSENQLKFLADYFWAFSRCCGDNPALVLKPIFDMWASLSDKKEENGYLSPRNRVLSYGIDTVFQRYIPHSNIIAYFVSQTKRKELEWVVTYMLHGIDDSFAVEYLAKYLAKRAKNMEGEKGHDHFLWHSPEVWERQAKYHSKTMSKESKDTLYKLWSNNQLDKYLRVQSLKLWSASHAKNDIELLKEFQSDEVLHDTIMIQRIKRKDKGALSLLVIKIRAEERTAYWWQFARELWSDELLPLLEEELSKKSQNKVVDSDWITYQLIMDLPISVAEEILLRHWEYIKNNFYFIQTALFIATDRLASLVHEVILNLSEPKEYFILIDSHYGLRTINRVGLTRIKQLEVLVPYLDYLEDNILSEFAEECNKKGWFEFRKKYFDTRLMDKKSFNREYFSLDNLLKVFDWINEEENCWKIKGWIEDLLKTEVIVDDIFSSLKKWLESKDNIDDKIVKISLKLLVEFGNRELYYQFVEVFDGQKDEYIEEFENAFYLIRRRELG